MKTKVASFFYYMSIITQQLISAKKSLVLTCGITHCDIIWHCRLYLLMNNIPGGGGGVLGQIKLPRLMFVRLISGVFDCFLKNPQSVYLYLVFKYMNAGGIYD